MPSNILLIIMGGTIGALAYSEKDGEYPVNQEINHEKCVENALRDICDKYPQTNLTTINLCNKDSKDINAQDKENLFQTLISKSEKTYDRVIITMGTDRMSEIAQYIRNKEINLTYPVIFTGSIWPLANGKHSDGWQNLEQALLSNPKITPDIYINMGDVFAPAHDVEKDFENKVFINTKNLTNRDASS